MVNALHIIYNGFGVIRLDNETREMFTKLLEGQTRIEAEVKKNSIKLEEVEKKVSIIAEIQVAHKQQNEMSFRNTDYFIDEKADLIETATKSISKDVREVKESIEVLKDMTGRHEVDIKILKRRRV
jgi:hypothetical protein